MPTLLSLYDLFSEFGIFLSVADILLPVGLFPGGYTVIFLVLLLMLMLCLTPLDLELSPSSFTGSLFVIS